MKVALTTGALLFFGLLNHLHAEESKPEHELSWNVGVASEYRYRGISQTRLDPALQGGADYVHNPDGLYAGTWLSTIKWIKDTPGAGSTPAEWDIYAGKKGQLSADISYDAGALAYIYLNNKLDQAGLKDANTLEFYGQLSAGPAYLKYSHAVTNLFGIPDSKNSGYLDAGLNFDLGADYTLNMHAGYQKVRGMNSQAATYSDFKLGVTREWKEHGVTVSLAVIGTNADKVFYASPASGQFMGKSKLVITAVKSF